MNDIAQTNVAILLHVCVCVCWLFIACVSSCQWSQRSEVIAFWAEVDKHFKDSASLVNWLLSDFVPGQTNQQDYNLYTYHLLK